MKRCSAALLVAVLVILSAGHVRASWYWEAFPKGSVGVNRPAIGQRIELVADEVFDRAEMWLDGVAVHPTWNADTGYVLYVPPAPLGAGEHHVVLKIRTKSTKPGHYYNPLLSDYHFTVAADALTTLPPADAEGLLALAHLNSLRTTAGLPAFGYSTALGQAATMHALHVAQDPAAEAHVEVMGKPFATGVQPWNRSAYYGYGGGTSEVVAYCGDAVAAVDGWMATLYHRLPLVHPGNTELGYGHAGPGCREGFDEARLVEVIDAGPGQHGVAPALIRYPYDGQTGVPTWWPGAERPDPFRLYPGVEGPVGYTITLTWSAKPEDLTLTSWSLTGSDGKSVPVMTFTPHNDDQLSGACDTIALIPPCPLEPQTTYTVDLVGSVDLGSGPQPYAEKWSFTTADGQLEWGAFRCTWTSQGDSLNVTFNYGLWLRPGISVYLDGLPLREVQVSGGRDAFTGKLPSGYGRRQPQELLLVSDDGEEQRIKRFGTRADGTPIYIGAGTPSAFSATTVTLGSGAAPVAGLLHVGGEVMVPDAVLEDLGALSQSVPEISRTHWSLNAHSGCLTVGSVVAWIDGQRIQLPLAVMIDGGQTFIPKDFVDAFLVAARMFPDVRGSWAESYVMRLVELGVIAGFADGTFRPDAGLTRAALIKMLVASLELPLLPGDTGGFSDTAGTWVVQQGYLGAAAAAGITDPADYPGGRLDPDGNISREEIAVMVVRGMGLDEAARQRQLTIVSGRTTIGERVFTDADTWQYPGHVALAVENGVVKGFAEADGTYTFRPASSATRAQAAALIVGMLDAMAGVGD